MIHGAAVRRDSRGAGRGDRTLTGRSPRVFETRASADSAIPAGPSRVAARLLRNGVRGLVLSIAFACTAAPPTGGSPSSATHTIAFLFDGSFDDADDVSGPALAGLELAALQGPGIEVEPVNVGVSGQEAAALLAQLGDDRGVVAAVVAPWTVSPEGASGALASAGIPVVSLSWAWDPPEHGTGVWLSVAADADEEARLLLAAGSAPPEGAGRPCLAGEPDAAGARLAELVTIDAVRSGGSSIANAGVVDPGRPATAEAVASRIAEAGCATVLWTGGATAAALLVASPNGPGELVGTSRLKTDDGLAVAEEGGASVSTVCACADVTLSLEPRSQRFVHDVQAESAAAPGPYALEAYDVGRMLIGAMAGSGGTREGLAAGLDGLERARGLRGAYRFERDGSATPGTTPRGWWRAAGSRWLPLPVPSS